MYSFEHLVFPKNVASGIGDFVYLAPTAWFNSIKAPVGPFAPGEQVIIQHTHSFKPGKGFVKLSMAPEKNQYDAKTIGDKGSQQLANEVRVFIPGSYEELHEQAKNWLNTPLIGLFKDSNCAADLFYQVGSDCVPAYMSLDFSTGTSKDGVKGYIGTITCSAPSVTFYAGIITLKGSIPIIGTSALFLSPLTVHHLFGSLNTVAIAYQNALFTDITDIFNTLVVQAGSSIIQLYLINDNGLVVSDLVDINLSSEMDFIDDIEAWLTANGTTQSFSLSGNELMLVDPDALQYSFIGIAIPVLYGVNGSVYGYNSQTVIGVV